MFSQSGSRWWWWYHNITYPPFPISRGLFRPKFLQASGNAMFKNFDFWKLNLAYLDGHLVFFYRLGSRLSSDNHRIYRRSLLDTVDLARTLWRSVLSLLACPMINTIGWISLFDLLWIYLLVGVDLLFHNYASWDRPFLQWQKMKNGVVVVAAWQFGLPLFVQDLACMVQCRAKAYYTLEIRLSLCSIVSMVWIDPAPFSDCDDVSQTKCPRQIARWPKKNNNEYISL